MGMFTLSRRLGSYLNYIYMYIVSFTSLARFLWMMKFAGGHLDNGSGYVVVITQIWGKYSSIAH